MASLELGQLPMGKPDGPASGATAPDLLLSFEENRVRSPAISASWPEERGTAGS
jgi:hypothetical protein